MGIASEDPAQDPRTTDLAPRQAAAAAMRRLGHAMVAHHTDVALLERIARQATATAEVVEAQPKRVRPVLDIKRRMYEETPPAGAAMAHFDECIVSGQANPMGVAMRVRREDERVIADLTLGAAFEGAPLRAHGGVVAAILDDIMGYVLLLQATPAYTGQLSITYLAPTPVEASLIATAWLDRREGRKLFVASTITAPEGTLIARGDGLFIAVPSERLRDAEGTLRGD